MFAYSIRVKSCLRSSGKIPLNIGLKLTLIKFCALACDCSGLSDECYFDAELYETTGHGGHCINCRENTRGPHCEHCSEEFYRDVDDTGRCLPCACHPDGKFLQTTWKSQDTSSTQNHVICIL